MAPEKIGLWNVSIRDSRICGNAPGNRILSKFNNALCLRCESVTAEFSYAGKTIRIGRREAGFQISSYERTLTLHCLDNLNCDQKMSLFLR